MTVPGGGWGAASSAAPQGGEQPVTVLLAFPVTDPRQPAFTSTLQLDARFRLAATAGDPQDFQVKLGSSPEAVIIEGRLFPGPQPLAQALTSLTGSAYLFLPAQAPQDQVESFKQIPSVKQVIVGDAPMADLLARVYGDALSLRRTAPALGTQAWGGNGQRSALVAGLRILTVWNRVGGAGRTTIATALAQAVSRRNLKTLLVGLGAPDVMPVHIGLKSEPNIMSFFNSPTSEGFRSGLQKLAQLDVLPGFPDIGSEHNAMATSQISGAKGTLGELVSTATYDGYAAILLDTPTESFAPQAIMASNSWLLVARATIADAWAAVEAYRAVTQRLAGQHRINPGNVVVVLNQRASGQLTPDEWHKAADAACRKLGLQVGFPPVASVIPFIPEVSLAQDAGRPVLDSSDEFARPIHKLADLLFGGVPGASSNGHDKGKVFQLGPIKLRSK